ncbi:50S ribosomal protein L21e [Candidatus Woesearchaeota archaeon]|nr:50S ribosomal protein L21e [Candidatus Woesearchaeota archaeon]
MVDRVGGFRRKSGSKLTKSHRQQGKISITRFLQTFKEGEQVTLSVEPAVQGGMYFPRFYQKSGIVTGMRGVCYMVAIKDMNKAKTVIVHPVHLRKVK